MKTKCITTEMFNTAQSIGISVVKRTKLDELWNLLCEKFNMEGSFSEYELEGKNSSGFASFKIYEGENCFENIVFNKEEYEDEDDPCGVNWNNVLPSVIEKVFERYAPKKKKTKTKKIDKNRLKRMIGTMTTGEIAKSLGRSYQYVYSLRKKYQI